MITSKSGRRPATLVLGLTLAVGTLGLAACGSSSNTAAPSSSSTSSSASSSGTSASSSGFDAKYCSGPNPTIEYIPKLSGNSYFNVVQSGLQQAATDYGYKLVVSAPATADATTQIPYIETAVANKVCALLISPNDPSALDSTLGAAMKAGIIVLSVNSDMDAVGRLAAVMPTDFTKVGPGQVNLLESELPASCSAPTATSTQCQIAIISTFTTAPDQGYWVKGIQATIAAHYPNTKIVYTGYGQDEAAPSVTAAEQAVASNPDIMGMIIPTAAGMPAVTQAFDTAQRCGPNASKPIVLVGLALPSSMGNFLADHCVKSFQLWDPAKEGVTAVQLVQAIAHQGYTPANGTNVTVAAGTGSTPGQTITVATGEQPGEVAGGPFLTFTSANIGQYKF